MAQVLVTKISEWYQGVASLKNHSEKELERRVFKYAHEIFSRYYSFISGFTFTHSTGLGAKPDIILIAEDFSQWVIVELELTGKPLKHTLNQLKVFSNPMFNETDFTKHCVSKEPKLQGHEPELNYLFQNKDPQIVVLLDAYHQSTIQQITSNFTCKICVFEVYISKAHQWEVYRISGDYPHIYTSFCFLTQIASSPDHYIVQRPQFFAGKSTGEVTLLHYSNNLKGILTTYRGALYLKIPNNPFVPGEHLKVSETITGEFVIEKI